MSENLKTDHVKLESPSILTKKILFCPAIGGGAAIDISTPVSSDLILFEFTAETIFFANVRAPHVNCYKDP